MMAREDNSDSLTSSSCFQDVDGSVLGDQGHLIRPGESAYRSIVLSAVDLVAELSSLSFDNNQSRTSEVVITESNLLLSAFRRMATTSFVGVLRIRVD